MRFTIYALTDEPQRVVFERQLSGFDVDSDSERRALGQWSAFHPVAVCEADGELVHLPDIIVGWVPDDVNWGLRFFKLILDRDRRRHELTAEEVLRGDAGKEVEFLWKQGFPLPAGVTP